MHCRLRTLRHCAENYDACFAPFSDFQKYIAFELRPPLKYCCTLFITHEVPKRADVYLLLRMLFATPRYRI